MSEPHDGRGDPVRHGLAVAAALVGAGVLVGLVWWLVAPRAQIRIESDGGFFLDPHPEQYVAGDAVFGLLSLAAGLLAGIVVWRLSRRQSMAAVVGLAVGGLAGAWLGRLAGVHLGDVDPAALAKEPVGTIVSVSLSLTAVGLLLVLPVVSVATWLVCDLLADARASRRRPPDPLAPVERPEPEPVSPAGPPEPAPPTSA